MQIQRACDQAASQPPAESTLAAALTTIAERVSRLWRHLGHPRRASGSPDTDWEQRVETLEANTKHLEAVLEGLQDAVYRRALLEDENIGELRRRMEPDQIARELSRDAQRRGL